MTIARFSLGAGDRFGREGVAQVAAFRKIKEDGVDVDLVWNKSNREHVTVGTSPADQRKAADEAAKATGLTTYYVDADHINADSIDKFIEHCNFFTIDMTSVIGKATTAESAEKFLADAASLLGPIPAANMGQEIEVTQEVLAKIADRYLFGVEEAYRIYEHIKAEGGQLDHIEFAVDESPETQGPADLYVLLFALSHIGLPIDTVAVKFQGRFNKGVDYVGDVDDFLAEFRADVAIIQYAITRFGLHENLKISVHTGSDKFSLYQGIGKIVRELGAGLHLKTAGTTWLEELVGLAEADGEGLVIAKDVYRGAFDRYDELVAPYLDVIDIDKDALPSPDEVDVWDSEKFATTLRHDQSNPNYDANVRQLLHVGYKIAAKMGQRYLDALEAHREHVERNVTENLYARHLKPLFLPQD